MDTRELVTKLCACAASFSDVAAKHAALASQRTPNGVTALNQALEAAAALCARGAGIAAAAASASSAAGSPMIGGAPVTVAALAAWVKGLAASTTWAPSSSSRLHAAVVAAGTALVADLRGAGLAAGGGGSDDSAEVDAVSPVLSAVAAATLTVIRTGAVPLSRGLYSAMGAAGRGRGPV